MKQDGPWDCINVIASSKEAFYVDAVESFLFEEGGGEYQYLRVAQIFNGLWGRNFVDSNIRDNFNIYKTDICVYILGDINSWAT